MNDELTQEDVDAQAIPAPEGSGVSEWQGAGARLRQARERLNLSLEDVASQIKTAPRKIAALEAERWAELPERPYLRGLVRNYARVLQLDAEPLLRSVDAATGAGDGPQGIHIKPTLHAPFPQRAAGPHESPVNKLIVLGITICVIVIAALVLPGVPALRDATSMVLARWHADEASAPANENTPDSVAPRRSPAGEGSDASAAQTAAATPSLSMAPAVPSPGLATQADGVGKPAQASPAAPADDKSPIAAAVSVSSVPPAPVPARSAPVPLDGAGGGALSLQFKDDSWVEVRQPDGKIVSSQIYHAGTEQAIDASHPIELVIGNAPGVSLSYRGKAIDLDPYTRARVARLNLP